MFGVSGVLSHAAVVSRECGLPAVVQVKNAMKAFPSGTRIVVDGEKGTVSLEKPAES